MSVNSKTKDDGTVGSSVEWEELGVTAERMPPSEEWQESIQDDLTCNLCHNTTGDCVHRRLADKVSTPPAPPDQSMILPVGGLSVCCNCKITMSDDAVDAHLLSEQHRLTLPSVAPARPPGSTAASSQKVDSKHPPTNPKPVAPRPSPATGAPATTTNTSGGVSISSAGGVPGGSARNTHPANNASSAGSSYYADRRPAETAAPGEDEDDDEEEAEALLPVHTQPPPPTASAAAARARPAATSPPTDDDEDEFGGTTSASPLPYHPQSRIPPLTSSSSSASAAPQARPGSLSGGGGGGGVGVPGDTTFWDQAAAPPPHHHHPHYPYQQQQQYQQTPPPPRIINAAAAAAADLAEEEEFVNDPIVTKPGADQYHCLVCDVHISGSLSEQQHRNGAPHRKKVELRRFQQTRGGGGAGGAAGGGAGGMHGAPGYSDQMEHILTRGNAQFHCTLCQVDISGLPSLQQHLVGALHIRRATAAAGVGGSVGGTHAGYPAADARSDPFVSVRNEASEQFFCELCLVAISGYTSLDQHVAGGSHLRAKLAHATGGMGGGVPPYPSPPPQQAYQPYPGFPPSQQPPPAEHKRPVGEEEEEEEEAINQAFFRKQAARPTPAPATKTATDEEDDEENDPALKQALAESRREAEERTLRKAQSSTTATAARLQPIPTALPEESRAYWNKQRPPVDGGPIIKPPATPLPVSSSSGVSGVPTPTATPAHTTTSVSGSRDRDTATTLASTLTTPAASTRPKKEILEEFVANDRDMIRDVEERLGRLNMEGSAKRDDKISIEPAPPRSTASTTPIPTAVKGAIATQQQPESITKGMLRSLGTAQNAARLRAAAANAAMEKAYDQGGSLAAAPAATVAAAYATTSTRSSVSSGLGDDDYNPRPGFSAAFNPPPQPAAPGYAGAAYYRQPEMATPPPSRGSVSSTASAAPAAQDQLGEYSDLGNLQYRCNVCSIAISGHENLNQHMAGRLHKNKMAARGRRFGAGPSPATHTPPPAAAYTYPYASAVPTPQPQPTPTASSAFYSDPYRPGPAPATATANTFPPSSATSNADPVYSASASATPASARTAFPASSVLRSASASINQSAEASSRFTASVNAPTPAAPAEAANPIAIINEYVQLYKLPNPWFALVEEPSIANFEFELRFRTITTRGRGRSKQEAKKAAAIEALARIEKAKRQGAFSL